MKSKIVIESPVQVRHPRYQDSNTLADTFAKKLPAHAPIASSEGSSNFSVSSSSISKTIGDSERIEEKEDPQLADTSNNSNCINQVISSNVTDGLLNTTIKSAVSFALTRSFMEEPNGIENGSLRKTDDEYDSECVSLNDTISSASNTASILTWSNESSKSSGDGQGEDLEKRLEKCVRGIIVGKQFVTTAQKIGKKLNETLKPSVNQQYDYKTFENPSITQSRNQANNLPIKKPPLSASVYAGVVVTSSRSSRRRTSNCEATKLFALATSGSQSSLEPQNGLRTRLPLIKKDKGLQTPFDQNHRTGKIISSSK